MDEPISPYIARPPAPPTEQESLASLLGMGLGGKQSKVDALQRQIDQAHALRGMPKHHYSTWAGGLAGGLGDVLGDVADTRHMDQLRTQQAPLREQIDQGMQTFGGQYLAQRQDAERKQAEIEAARRAQQALFQQQEDAPWTGAAPAPLTFGRR